MLSLTISHPDSGSQRLEINHFPCRIGRHRDNEVVLASWRVARHHALLHRDGDYLALTDHGSLIGTWVNNARVAEYGPLTDDDRIAIAGYRLQLHGTDAVATSPPIAPVVGDDSEHPQPTAVPVPSNSGAGKVAAANDPLVLIRRELHARLLDSMDLRRQEIRHLNASHLRSTARAHLQRIVARLASQPDDKLVVPHGADAQERLIDLVLDEAIGLGVLEQLLGRGDISEIMVNGCASVFIECDGQLQDTGLSFSSDEAILSAIERIVSPIGRRIDDASPMVDARLPDGSRVNAIIPPLAIEGPCLTIRRFHSRRFGPRALVEMGSLSDQMMQFLIWSVRNRLNIVVSGGTGSGKTTLLNVLSTCIDAGERLVTIEDAAELQLTHPNKVTLEARPANSEGSGLVTIRDLVRNALRMRPDRIVVGECRGGEALDMLAAMNTGHDGSLTTIHANSARDALSRLEVMVLMSGVDIPVAAIREQIASAIDIIVHQQRERGGKRRIVEIVEVTGMEGVKIQTQPLFLFQFSQGRFRTTGQVPMVFDRHEHSQNEAIRKLFRGQSDE